MQAVLPSNAVIIIFGRKRSVNFTVSEFVSFLKCFQVCSTQIFKWNIWFSACIFAYVAFDTGSSRFQNFEYDNTTAGEDLHCI